MVSNCRNRVDCDLGIAMNYGIVSKICDQDNSIFCFKRKNNCTLPVLLIFLVLLCPDNLKAQTIVPTFHSFSIYWPIQQDSGLIGTCKVSYKREEESSWHEALPLWFDQRNGEFRGSIVHLISGKDYLVRLIPEDSARTTVLSASTWSEEFPIADTVYLPKESNQPFVIDRSGTSNGYILYTHKPGDSAVIDVQRLHSLCVEVADSTAYIIIRGLILRGAQQHGIRLHDHVHDVVIEQNDISGWGTDDADGWGLNRQSAIFSAKKYPNIERIIIQYNKLHHPKTNSNSWVEQRINGSFHPSGPQAIHLAETKGNHVIRFNDIYSDSTHYFNDGIGAAENFSHKGFPNKDSDIYGNKISNCWDDGIESEGANQNVRIWGNYIDSTYVKIAIASTSIGPLYIWRNIANTSRKSALESDSDMYERGPFIKAGGLAIDSVFYGGGRTYVFHNTIYQQQSGENDLPLGSGSAIQASGGYLYNVISRNNIFLQYQARQAAFLERADSCTNDFDYDIYNGKLVDSCNFEFHEKNGIQLAENELIAFDTLKTAPKFTLSTDSKGIDAGQIIPNFNDDFLGNGPDMGAVERGKPPMPHGAESRLKGQYLSTSNILIFLLLGTTALGLIMLYIRAISKNK